MGLLLWVLLMVLVEPEEQRGDGEHVGYQK